MPERSSTSHLIFALALLALVIFLQAQNGAFQSDFGGHPDEAAHVVTGLMVRDYLAGPLWHLQHPMHYAQDYYDHFPKVALGHYPPGFYLVMGLWLLPVRSKLSILIFSAVMTVIAALLTSRMARSMVSQTSAMVCGLAFVLLPLVQTYTAIVMSDLMVVSLTILALMNLQQFFHTERLSSALGFGIFAALAILTKAAGLFLALAPALVIILSGRWRVLKNWRFWMAPIPVIIFALPWMLYSWKITADGLSSEPLGQYAKHAVAFYSGAVVREIGWAGLILLVLGLAARWLKNCIENEKKISWAIHGSAILSLLAFYICTPSGLDERYLLPILPSALILALYGVESLVAMLRPSPQVSLTAKVAATVAAVVIVLGAWRPTGKLFTGAEACIQQSLAHEKGATCLLVSGSANTEGALVAAAALNPHHDSLTVIRATKALAETDWMGRNYVSKYKEPSVLLSYLHSAHVAYVILDTPVTGDSTFPHEFLLAQTLKDAGSHTSSGDYREAFSLDGQRRGAPPVTMCVFDSSVPSTSQKE